MHVHSLTAHKRIYLYHCTKDQIKNQSPKMLISRFKFMDYSYFNSCSIFKTPITQIAKSPVLLAGEKVIQNLDMGLT